MQTPKALGYRMPAEWAPHQATWLSWPHKEASWPGKLDLVLSVYARAVAALARSEPVHINVSDAVMEAGARTLLAEARARGEIYFHRFPTDDAWCRDHGAIFVTRDDHPRLAAVDWDYNAWGGKYEPYDLDDQIPRQMAAYLDAPCFHAGMVLEGGSIDVDGRGLLLTTEQCLLNLNRNPLLSKAEIEERLRDYLGVEKVLWLGEGIAGDDTDGHIDDIVRFVAPHTVVAAVEEDPRDENYHVLQENLRRLQLMTDLEGRRLTVLTIPMPPPVVHEGQRLPASHANWYVANTVILLPTFGGPSDEQAAEVLRRCYPDRQVVGIDCTDVVWGMGSWHCLTQQVPAV